MNERYDYEMRANLKVLPPDLSFFAKFLYTPLVYHQPFKDVFKLIKVCGVIHILKLWLLERKIMNSKERVIFK